MSERDFDGTAGAVGGAVGAVVGTAFQRLVPFSPRSLLVAAAIAGITAYVGYHVVSRYRRRGR